MLQKNLEKTGKKKKSISAEKNLIIIPKTSLLENLEFLACEYIVITLYFITQYHIYVR